MSINDIPDRDGHVHTYVHHENRSFIQSLALMRVDCMHKCRVSDCGLKLASFFLYPHDSIEPRSLLSWLSHMLDHTHACDHALLSHMLDGTQTRDRALLSHMLDGTHACDRALLSHMLDYTHVCTRSCIVKSHARWHTCTRLCIVNFCTNKYSRARV